jgi:hypothetical protein
MIKYLELASLKNDAQSMNILGGYYKENKDYSAMEKYFSLMIKNGYHVLHKFLFYDYLKTNMPSLSEARLVLSHAANTVSQPSSLVLAVNSETLSVGA